MSNSLGWNTSRGLERVLLQENTVSDLLQFLSDLDASPWQQLVGITPLKLEREVVANNRADLLLVGSNGERAIIEVKVGHVFSEAQQKSYERVDTATSLYLAALNFDEQRLTAGVTDRWRFLSLSSLFGAWLDSKSGNARVFAQEICAVFRGWEEVIQTVYRAPNNDARPVSDIQEKALARVLSRRMAIDLQERGLLSYAGTASGGGVPLLQVWTPVHGEGEDRCFIAEVRWKENHPIGEFRFGIDFDPRPGEEENEEVRRAAFHLATAMEEALDFRPLHQYLQVTDSRLADLIQAKGASRPAPKGDWEQIIQYGFEGVPRTTHKKPTRNQIRPAFHGDGALRFQAMVGLDFTKITALEVLDLLEVTLAYLKELEPIEN